MTTRRRVASRSAEGGDAISAVGFGAVEGAAVQRFGGLVGVVGDGVADAGAQIQDPDVRHVQGFAERAEDAQGDEFGLDGFAEPVEQQREFVAAEAADSVGVAGAAGWRPR